MNKQKSYNKQKISIIFTESMLHKSEDGDRKFHCYQTFKNQYLKDGIL